MGEIVQKRAEQGINFLKELNCIEISNEFLTSTLVGVEFARQCISVKSLATFRDITFTNMSSFLEHLFSAAESNSFHLKQGEKKLLKELSGQIPFPYKKSSIALLSKKLVILFQARLTHLSIGHWELKQQASELLPLALRILYCFKRICIEFKKSQCLVHTLKLIKAVKSGVWEHTPHFDLLQIEGVKQSVLNSLLENKIDSLAALQSCPNLEVIVKKDIMFKRISGFL